MDELDPALYTIAWIAPLEIEARAARCILDHVHSGHFPISRGDDYVFQAGDINGHNIVIATLPPGTEYGTGSAAALASQVKKFFPNLWFGLLVGVAAGLPNLDKTPPVDIRLGDVLVSLPQDGRVGLVAYELGKVTENEGFKLLQEGRVAANSETVVRSAIGSIKMLAPNDTDRFLPFYKAIKDMEHADGTFRDPGQEKDVLYKTNPWGLDTLVRRDRRPEPPDNKRTRVWYGAIGSGDKLMKNSRKRDELRDKYGLIGLEMEAAGLINRIPAGVIRGVCDYGDRHKNKDWQPYAAAMAAAYAKAVLVEMGRGKAVAAVQGPPTTSTGVLLLSELPPKTERFFGREKELVNMKSILRGPSGNLKSTVLYGISGAGKTQLVREFLAREVENFSAVLWIDATSETSIENSFATCSAHIRDRFPELRDHARDLSPRYFVLEWLRGITQKNWLVVIDGLDNLLGSRSLLDPFTDIHFGSLCVTSTQRVFARAIRAREIVVERLDPQASQSIILWKAFEKDHGIGTEARELSRRVAKVIDGFALGLELAGILIHEGIVSLEAFPTAFAADYCRVTQFCVDPGFWPWNKPESLFQMFEALYQSLVQRNPGAGLLLSLCSIYGPTEMPASLLGRLELSEERLLEYPENWSQLRELIRNQVAFNMALYDLHRVFLLTKRQDATGGLSSIALHSSICQWRLATLGKEHAEYIIQATYGLARHIQSEYPCNDSGEESADHFRRFLSISDRCLKAIREHVPDDQLDIVHGRHAERYYVICSSLAPAYLAVGRYDMSEQLFTAAIDHLRTYANGTNERGLLRLLRGYAQSCRKSRQLDKAAEALDSALRIATSTFGEFSEQALDIDSGLRDVRYFLSSMQSNYQRAVIATRGAKLRELERFALESPRASGESEAAVDTLGEEHPDTLTSMANLALTYGDQGRWKEAEELEVRVMETRKRVLGEEHPHTLTSMANLASTFRNQGRWKEAEELQVGVIETMKGVMETMKRVLGEEHPSTLTSMANLSSTYRSRGRWKEAEELQVRVMETRKRVLGEEHPHTLSSMANLSSTYRSRGRRKEAEELQVRVMETRKRVLGEEHPHTLSSMHNLAVTWRDQSRTKDALALMRNCVVLRERVLDIDHPDAASSAAILAEWENVSALP